MLEKKIKEKQEETEKKEKKISLPEFEKKVLELAKQGLTSEKIGEKLRQEKIHPQEFNKKISKILKEKDTYEIPELKNVQAKLEKIKTHLGKNKNDKRALREKDRVFSQIRKIKKYFKED